MMAVLFFIPLVLKGVGLNSLSSKFTHTMTVVIGKMNMHLYAHTTYIPYMSIYIHTHTHTYIYIYIYTCVFKVKINQCGIFTQ